MKRPGAKTASYWRTKEEVEAEYGAWHEESRYDPEADDYDAAAYEALVKEIVEKAGLTQPEIGLGWRDLTVQVDVASGAPVETVGTQALGVWKGVYQSVLGLVRWRRAARLPPEDRYHTIMSKVSGYARPGEMVLVLAPPGGGASTLLKMLALRHEGFANSSGQVLYNGEEIPASHAVAFKHALRVIGQDDEHFPQLSVRDTLSYAAEFKVPDFYPYAPVLRRHRVLQVARTLGISNTLDTPVGDAILRGVSGGEKKRVTVGEMAVAGVAGSLVLMDNWSRGLDSATTLDITKAIRGFAQRSRAVVVSSMQQPPEEVFDQFDRVRCSRLCGLLRCGCAADGGMTLMPSLLSFFCSIRFARPTSWCDGYRCGSRLTPACLLGTLVARCFLCLSAFVGVFYPFLFMQLCVLDAGRCLYYGPTQEAAAYFTSLGFTRPPTRSIPELITTVSDPNFQEGLITRGCESTAPRTVGDFVDAFSRSSHNKDVQDALDEGVKGERDLDLTPDLQRKVHRTALQSPFRQFGILFSRSVRLIVAQPVTFVVTVLANVVFGLALGSIFFNVDETEAGAFSRVRFLSRLCPGSALAPVSFGLGHLLPPRTLMLPSRVSVTSGGVCPRRLAYSTPSLPLFFNFLCFGRFYVCDWSGWRSHLVCAQGGLLFLGMLFLAFGEGMDTILPCVLRGQMEGQRSYVPPRPDLVGIACDGAASLTTQGLVLFLAGHLLSCLRSSSHSRILAHEVWRAHRFCQAEQWGWVLQRVAVCAIGVAR